MVVGHQSINIHRKWYAEQFRIPMASWAQMTLEARYYKTKAAREEARKALLGPGLRIPWYPMTADDRHWCSWSHNWGNNMNINMIGQHSYRAPNPNYMGVKILWLDRVRPMLPKSMGQKHIYRTMTLGVAGLASCSGHGHDPEDWDENDCRRGMPAEVV